MLDEYNKILNKLNMLDKILNNYPSDSIKSMNADKEFNKLVFNRIPPQDCGLIVKSIGRRLTNKDFANMIVALDNKRPFTQSLRLPLNTRMALALRMYQRKTGLTQSAFAKKYGIQQSKLSKMEDGIQKVDDVILDKIARDLHQIFKLGIPVK